MKQVACQKQVVVFGELMMRLSTKRYEKIVQAREFDVSYSGAEVNLAAALAAYGVGCWVVSSAPTIRSATPAWPICASTAYTSTTSSGTVFGWGSITSRRVQPSGLPPSSTTGRAARLRSCGPASSIGR